jgi:hypothetical protein
MSDSGWKSPGTVVSDNSVGTIAWTTPENAKSGDGATASYSPGSMSDPKLGVVKLVVGGSVSGNNKGEGSYINWTEKDFGSSSDLWGNTLSVSDVNSSNFGVVLQGIDDLMGYGDSEYLKATNFGFSVPSNSTIDGIIVRVTLPDPDDYHERIPVDHIQIKVYYTEGGTNASSERGLYIKGGKHYSKESSASLKTNDTNLATSFTEQEYTNVATDNDTCVDLIGTHEYFQFLFKEPNDNSTDDFRITWKGKSTVAPSSHTVYLQIYNRTTSSWTNLTSNNSASANTKFTLTYDITTGMSDYYDANHVISARIYQDVVV